MAKDRFEFARIASPEEVAEYLTSLAVGLKRGDVSLESGDRSLRLNPGSEVKLELKVGQKDRKGKIELQIGWKRPAGARAGDLRVAVGPRPTESRPTEPSPPSRRPARRTA
ncbi:MAG TPA: amphi-Trp domain-containing protein [Methylomirabilota bacterium]|jgi:amphi-Trp domain-containing protein